MPFELLVLLDLEELAPLGVVLDFGVEELGLGEPIVVKVVVPGGESHFSLSEDEREETVLATPFGCCKMAHEGRNMLDDVSHGVEGGLPYNCVEQDGFHPPSHHFGDGSHNIRDSRHVCTVCSLKIVS